MAKEGIFKKITRRFKKKPAAKVSGDTTRIIIESRKQAIYGAPKPTEPEIKRDATDTLSSTDILSSVSIHKYSSFGNIYIHVMFISNLKYLNKIAIKKDPITRKLDRVKIGKLDTDYYGKGGKLLY